MIHNFIPIHSLLEVCPNCYITKGYKCHPTTKSCDRVSLYWTDNQNIRGHTVPGYKFITALCPTLIPSWIQDWYGRLLSEEVSSKSKCHVAWRLQHWGFGGSFSPKSFVRFLANWGVSLIQETRQWQQWGFADRCSFSFTKHCRSHSGAECTDAFLHPPTTQEMLSTTHMTERGLRHKIVDLPEHNAFALFSQECRIIYRIQIHSQDAEGT